MGRERRTSSGTPWSRYRARRVAVGWITLVVLASAVDPAAVFDLVDPSPSASAGGGATAPFSIGVFALSHLVAYGVLAWLVVDGVALGTESSRDGGAEPGRNGGAAPGRNGRDETAATDSETAVAGFGTAAVRAETVAIRRSTLAAVGVAAAVGLGVELLQAPLAARTASGADAALNALGAAAGVGARALWHRARR
ncbi:hypothetical protein [Halobellus rarus]|uniref:VanZ like family protein n=1 Tax=Halobellus rarus TaxID=1126237 RepID=A0ABD6CJ16_9EURY|nr:hypothetical protein [Halobellus rarus]